MYEKGHWMVYQQFCSYDSSAIELKNMEAGDADIWIEVTLKLVQ